MCDHRLSKRRGRRSLATRGKAYARAGRPVRTGSFAHRCGVSRCGQIFVPVRPIQEPR
ncbi:hypothetical protein ACIBH1_27045 [Nonomuraea sp. NPDC050663]|uniref:hypothetical protein n=1 Tax=Nonomuraea sp. NPDC050663 TaxID=3364370 RepID=UPI0017B6CECC|nr:hypothetical protein [Thermoactinospora sp.]